MFKTFFSPGLIIKIIYQRLIPHVSKNFKTHIFFLMFFLLTIKTFSNDLRPANCQPDGDEVEINSEVYPNFNVCFDFDFPVFSNEWTITVSILDAVNNNVFSEVINGVDGNGPSNCIAFITDSPFIPEEAGVYTLEIHVQYGSDINNSNDICTTSFIVINPVPAEITNISPPNGATNVPLGGGIFWQNGNIQITNSTINLSPVPPAQGTSFSETLPGDATSFTPDENLLPGTNYQWTLNQTNLTGTTENGPFLFTTELATTGTIIGRKFKDENGNGIFDSSEVGLQGWEIDLSNGQTTETDSAGFYSFTVEPGMYEVSEVQQNNWTQTFPEEEIYTLNVAAGQIIENINFGNKPNDGFIKGKKFRDENNNGKLDIIEHGVSSWTIKLDNNQTAVTDSNGNYIIKVPPGSYIVSEEERPFWNQTFPQGGTHSVTVTAGQTVENINFGNRPEDGIVKGKKWLDINGNGQMDDGEPGLDDWSISLFYFEELYTTTTDFDGNYSITARPGTYSVREENLPGYLQTFPANLSGVLYHDIVLNPGQTIENLNFGNKPFPPDSVASLYPKDEETDVKASPPPSLLWGNYLNSLPKTNKLLKHSIPITSTTVTLGPVPPASGKIFAETFDKDTTSYTPPEDLEYGTVYQWTIEQTNDYGTTTSGPFTFTTTSTVSATQNESLPKEFKLYQNYPNPFNPTTLINYDVAETVNVKLVIYNMIGQKILVLVNKSQTPGKYNISFNANNLPSGIYIYTISLGDYFSAKKMILMK